MKTLKFKKSQISLEYTIILGFVMFVLIFVLGIAFFYSNTIKDRIKVSQIENFANKIILNAENVFYYGEPSKSTIYVYLPEGVKEITINGKNLIISLQLSSGIERSAFSSNVPIEGNISVSSGIKKIVILAEGNKTKINSV